MLTRNAYNVYCPPGELSHPEPGWTVSWRAYLAKNVPTFLRCRWQTFSKVPLDKTGSCFSCRQCWESPLLQQTPVHPRCWKLFSITQPLRIVKLVLSSVSRETWALPVCFLVQQRMSGSKPSSVRWFINFAPSARQPVFQLLGIHTGRKQKRSLFHGADCSGRSQAKRLRGVKFYWKASLGGMVRTLRNGQLSWELKVSQVSASTWQEKNCKKPAGNSTNLNIVRSFSFLFFFYLEANKFQFGIGLSNDKFWLGMNLANAQILVGAGLFLLCKPRSTVQHSVDLWPVSTLGPVNVFSYSTAD